MTAERIKSNPITKTTPKQQQIINLRTQHPNASGREIARIANADPSYTIEVLQRYGLIDKTTQDFKANRADILAGLQHRLISSITDEDIKKTPVGSRILAAAQLFDKEKAELGQSTDKQPVLVLVRGDNCNVQIGGKVEQDASANDKMSKLVDITPDDKSLHKLSD
jgi:hypothetical protein